MRLSNRATYSKSYQVPFASMFDEGKVTHGNRIIQINLTCRDGRTYPRNDVGEKYLRGWGQIPIM